MNFPNLLQITSLLIISSQTVLTAKSSENEVECGGVLTEPHGVLQTPNFPRPFNVPISCRWIIDASNIDAPNPSIVVYLTQLYVFTGLTFHEYAHYESESLKVGGQLIHTVTEQNVTRVLWIRTPAPFMVIEFRLDRLEGNHLRVLDNLLDVYGFNITYEISTFANPVRANSCNVFSCSYTGHCYVSYDFRNFACACFDGFSGPKCGTGPRCPINEQVCYNGGTCSHLGANDATCQCPPGYTGDRCDIQLPNSTEVGCEIDQESSSINCVSQCPVDEYLSSVCDCSHDDNKYVSDKVRYEGTIRLANLPAIRTSFPGYSTLATATSRSLEAVIEKQMSKYLKNSNLLKIEDLKILNITSGGEVTFHFFGGKKDSGRVRDAMNRLVERGRLGNFTLASTQLSTKQEPTLLLEKVSMNQIPPIRQGDEFSLSCVAQGSSYMTFNWFKDGIYVNVSKATRVMKTKVLSPDSDDRTVAILYINKAMGLDNGVYTCQVVDWGIKQCKSLRVDVLLPPQVQIIPMSITIQKGENVSIKCLSPNDRHHEKFGYNWTKNKSLFPLIPGKEVWEDLLPSGSILKIYNAQKSAIYTCMVHGRVDSRSASVRVEVTNRTLVPLCSSERYMNVEWPETAPGVETIQKCPDNLQGRVTRLCTLIDVLDVKWDLPNFSSCHSPDFYEIEDSFRGLTYGFQNTSGVETLSRCVMYLKQRGKLYPGEGQNVLRLLNDVFIYINVTLSTNEISEATQTLYEIVNLLLLCQHSIIQQQDIINLQQLTRSQALVWGSQMRSPHVEHISLSSLVLDVTSLESQTLHNLHIPLRGKSYPNWFEDKIDIRIESNNLHLFGNNSFTLNILTFRNIIKFLPIRYVAKRRDGIDLQYEIISRVINIEIGQADNRIIPTQGLFWVDLELVHATDNYTQQGWNVTCAITDVATFKHTWDLDSCSTRVINNSLTRCTCTRTGTYAVLWTRHIVSETMNPRKEQPFIVLTGCIICLVLSLISLGILIPYWWHHRTSLIFLKLQCSLSIAGAMAVFIYAVHSPVDQEQYIPIATALEVFLLIGMSSHLSKLLIVYTEIVVIPRVGQHLQQTVVCVITGVPILTVLSNHMAYRSLDLELGTWWLINGTLIFTIFVASATIMTILFIFIYFSLMRKLHRLIDKHLDKTKAISKRIGLLSRAALIFISIISMETASILFVNIHDPIHQYIFSASCVIVGSTIFICYIVKCESSLHLHFLRRFHLDKNIDENYSSESVNSPLSFFTKQDGEVETDSAPPSRMRGSAAGHASTEVTEGLLMSEARGTTKTGFYRYSEAPSSTIETYVHSISDNSVEKLYPNDLNNVQAQHLLDSQELVDLEHYPPQTSQNYIDLVHIPNRRNVKYGDYVAEIDVNKKYPSDVRYYYPEGSVNSTLIRPNPGKCYIRDYTIMTPATEMMTTRVCVELDLVKSPKTNFIGEANISVEAPSNVLCSVDVEPITESTTPPALPCNSKDTQLDLEDSSVTESTTNSDINIPKIEIKDMSDSSTTSGSERRQPEGAVGKKIAENGDNMDGMLDRISHDLDYLLNRTEENIPPIPQPVSSLRKPSKPPPSHNIIGQIREEDEDEEISNTIKTEDVDASIAKTVC